MSACRTAAFLPRLLEMISRFHSVNLGLDAEDGGSHFTVCRDLKQFCALTGGPRLQITSSAVGAPTATSPPAD